MFSSSLALFTSNLFLDSPLLLGMSEVVEPVGHSTEDIVELDLGSTDVESGDVTAKTEGPADTPPSDPDNEIHGVVEDHKGDTTENKTNGSIADGTKPAGSSHASGMLQGTKTSMENGAAKAHASGPITSPKKSAATDKAPAGKAVKSATPSASSVKKVSKTALPLIRIFLD